MTNSDYEILSSDCESDVEKSTFNYEVYPKEGSIREGDDGSQWVFGKWGDRWTCTRKPSAGNLDYTDKTIPNIKVDEIPTCEFGKLLDEIKEIYNYFINLVQQLSS